MDVGSGDSNCEGDALFAAGVGVFDTVVKKDAVVDTLGGCTGFHFRFPSFGASGYFGKEAWIPIRFGKDNSTVCGGRAVNAGCMGFIEGFGATPFDAATIFAEAPVDHCVTCRAERRAVVVNR